ncbi:MAG: YkgJ family cysteine cluster protein [Verrucomicrobiales bacterium]|nr:YkgJ family cysteine cluster protein [Verrucomicrobiales bacterium]
MPVFYDCQRCTACCRWPGEVRVTAAEIRRMAGYLGLTEDEFIQRHTRVRENRRGLALMERPNFECVLLEGDDCAVQPVKPQQCRDFPNLWRFPGFEQSCRAVPREVSKTDYARLLRRATGRRSIPPQGGTQDRRKPERGRSVPET